MAIEQVGGRGALGRWGWYEYAEPRVRVITAEQLGVDPEDLTADIALVDELAADSLDVLELGMALETAFEVEIPESALRSVRRYGDLVDVIVDLVAHRGGSWPPCLELVLLRVRLCPAGAPYTLERSEWLTPYGVETIAADAARAGAGAVLEVTLPRGAEPVHVARLEAILGGLAARGVTVTVSTRSEAAGPRRTSA